MSKGARIMGYIAAAISAAAFIGFLAGATHQIAIAAFAAACSIVLFAKSAKPNPR